MRRFHSLVILALEAICRNQEMDVVTVMPACIQLVSLHVAALIFGGRFKGVRRLLPLACLRPDVSWHVESMRDIGAQLGIPAAARPGVFGEGGTFEAVDDVMMHAHVVRSHSEQLAQN